MVWAKIIMGWISLGAKEIHPWLSAAIAHALSYGRYWTSFPLTKNVLLDVGVEGARAEGKIQLYLLVVYL